MRRKLFTLLVTLFLATTQIGFNASAAIWNYSCLNTSGAVTIYPTHDRQIVITAANYWNDIAGRTVVSVVDNPSQATVNYLNVDGFPYGQGTLAMTYAYGWTYNGYQGKVEIYPTAHIGTNVTIQDSAIHEIGHTLGLHHDDSDSGVSIMKTSSCNSAGGFVQRQHDYYALKETLAARGIIIDNPKYEIQSQPQVETTDDDSEKKSIQDSTKEGQEVNETTNQEQKESSSEVNPPVVDTALISEQMLLNDQQITPTTPVNYASLEPTKSQQKTQIKETYLALVGTVFVGVCVSFVIAAYRRV
ncbi:MAG: M12 family metallo-peptidase [Lactobacillaceae bacterium]|jgi:hypothetical protein|nr:M12 family metallo-peptidase [Lactobacillaceae bacterium]